MPRPYRHPCESLHAGIGELTLEKDAHRGGVVGPKAMIEASRMWRSPGGRKC